MGVYLIAGFFILFLAAIAGAFYELISHIRRLEKIINTLRDKYESF